MSEKDIVERLRDPMGQTDTDRARNHEAADAIEQRDMEIAQLKTEVERLKLVEEEIKLDHPWYEPEKIIKLHAENANLREALEAIITGWRVTSLQRVDAMTDIVERLRTASGINGDTDIRWEAADEIEKLRAERMTLRNFLIGIQRDANLAINDGWESLLIR